MLYIERAYVCVHVHIYLASATPMKIDPTYFNIYTL